MTILLFITDMITAVSVVLIFGSAFLMLEILRYLSKGGCFVLTRALGFFLPAIVVIAAVRIYDFFIRYTPLTAFFRELLYLLFTSLLFCGLLVQYMAIRSAIERRM